MDALYLFVSAPFHRSVIKRPVHIQYVVYLFFLAVGTQPAAVSAQSATQNDPLRFIRWTGSDAVHILPAITQIRPGYVLAAGATIYISSRYDRQLTDWADQYDGSEFVRVLEEFGNEKTVRPMSLMIFLGSLMQRNQRVQDAAFTAFESVVFTSLIVNGMKGIVGRTRPNRSPDSNRFTFFSGQTSFPSGHAATVFAFVTPWVLQFPGPITYTLLGLGAATSATRVIRRFHWLSDVIAGGSVGFATSWWLMKKHTGKAAGLHVSPLLSPSSVGLEIRF